MSRPLDLTRSGWYFAGFLLVALVAFYPTYLSLPFGETSGSTHLHAATAALWMATLVAQPIAIRRRRLDWHRWVGRASFLLGPLIIVSVLLLAHSRIRGLDQASPGYSIQTYVLYLQVSLAALFALCYGLAIYWRKTTALHSRFMVCTAFTLIDPVVIRLMFQIDPTPTWNYQWATFGLTDLVFVAMIWLDRANPRGRRLFAGMLVVFVLAQVPALFGLTQSAPWQAFARWFASLP